jgi:hypothetical protein
MGQTLDYICEVTLGMREKDETKGKIVRHIRAARQWLDQAEQSFDTEKLVRGELDLLLARAEVQHAQERKCQAPTFLVKLAMVVLRRKKMLGFAVGGMLVVILPMLYVSTFGQRQMTISAAYSFQPKTQLEIPAVIKPQSASAIVRSADIQTIAIDAKKMEKLDEAESKAVVAPVSMNSVIPTSAKSGQDTARASATDEELRMLMRTAERVLKSTN